ncbi:type IV pilin N-terminal domain-containing protein [uncultured Methanofollis sp.]|uniref:type IV pilin N-terminal domain-containing protein n=1 Tax=uncultured Methanofollis sp. TaxID=262500 RepID=UPI00260A0B30|nr:type IV pilin N-terminal domain-containing protein [uncultured Methanofollis sp.]
MNDRTEYDEAVSSVVGEMIMIVLVIILVALFATSVFSLIPGGRDASVEVAMTNVSDDSTVVFWHKGGDWVEKKDLTVVILREGQDRKEYTSPDVSLYDHNGDPTGAFDLGGRLEVAPDRPLKGGDIVRLVTQKNVVYSGEI